MGEVAAFTRLSLSITDASLGMATVSRRTSLHIGYLGQSSIFLLSTPAFDWPSLDLTEMWRRRLAVFCTALFKFSKVTNFVK